ncbi:MAG: putative DNA-binding domain-containing protein [Gammaproteobacteria bacterium]|nr:putative DNA-binding domain-containing protein [Gammaproteobacteria bacterium]
MADTMDFQRKQFAFAAHIRDPQHNPAPDGIEDRRMAIYRDLFFNNLLKLISNTFPVLRKLHSPERWRALVREFMVRHRASTPYFLEIPQEFLAFLEHEHAADAADFPFLAELAHYEWVELALSVSDKENDLSAVDPDGDLLDGTPVKSMLAWAFTYRFPVHRIAPDYLPDRPGDTPTSLVVYRRSDDEVSFMELNPVSAALLGLIENNVAAKGGRELLYELAESMNYPDKDAFVGHGATALEELRNAEVLIGTQRP